jgi:hypothetical protein
MSSAFDVKVIVEDDSNGRLEGPELERVAKLLRVSQGVPVFDLESEGRLLARCQLKAADSIDSLAFSYESSQPLDPPKSDPNATYR